MTIRQWTGQFRRVVLGLLARTAPAILLAPLLAGGTLVREDFAYGTGELRYENGGSGWTTAWSTGTTRIEVTSGSLSYAGGGYGIVQETSSNKAGSGYGGEPRGLYRGLGPLTGDIWFSCLMQNTHTEAEVALQFNPTTAHTTYSSNFVQLDDTSVDVRYGGTDYLNEITGLPLSTTILVIGNLVMGAGNDSLSLWVNPADLEGLGAPVFSQSGSDLGDNLYRIGLMGMRQTASGTGTPRATMDALRISDGGGDWTQAFFEVTGVMPFIPEPGAGMLLLSGLGALLTGRRHRRQA